MELNDEFKWMVEDASLLRTLINMVVYMINNTNGFQAPVAQITFKLQDVYAHKLTRLWLPLNEPDKVNLCNKKTVIS